MTLPIATAFILLSNDSFHFLAEGCLLGQIVFLLGTKTFKMLLMTLVDNGRGSFETSPNLFAKLLADGTCLTVFLMQLLQLMESADYIGLFGQFLCSFTELCL